ncbi:MAG: hypothetical protein GXP26_02320 [Planctomycetes bacterium]|nr:hypothetical protein [Planctomycetota bacterium]
MSEVTPDIAAEVVAACQEGAEEAAGALNRSLDGEFTLQVGETTTYSAGTPDGFDGPGLAILLKFGEVGVTAILPEASGMLPDWYSNPDPTGESKLSTLAQELSMLLVPETLIADVFEATRVPDIREALSAAGLAEDAALVPLQLGKGDATSQMSLIWPLATPDALLPASAADDEVAAPPPPSEPKSTAAATASAKASKNAPQDFSGLPTYSRSLLNIKVSVHVVLATKKESISDVVEMAPGTIIKFDKSCDELLRLYVGDQEVAEGEAIKIGDMFGFRVNAMRMPKEHFMKVPPKNAG